MQAPEGSHKVRLARRLKIKAILQLEVTLGRNPDWEAGLKSCDSGQSPTIENFAGEALLLGDWQLPIVAEDEAVARVKERQRAVGPEIEGIEQVLKARSVVD